jgi:D-alanyl-D-alanine dipeptidase
MFGVFFALRNRPLPDLSPLRERLAGAKTLPIDVTDTRSAEPLIALQAKSVKGSNYYGSDRNPPYWGRAKGAIDELWGRHTAVDKLAEVNAHLATMSLRLHVFDAWRPREVQAYFYEQWVPAALRKNRPDLSGEALNREVARYWAAPSSDPARPSPHATGGAFDLTLTWEDGQPLFMGGIFDDASAISHTGHFETLRPETDFSFSAEEARANRRLLFWVMNEAGFANYPDEWWHYSWGDQMWAALTGAPAAIYGAAEPPGAT